MNSINEMNSLINNKNKQQITEYQYDMDLVLMHKDIEVLLFNLNTNKVEILNKVHLPEYMKNKASIMRFREWLDTRLIQANRYQYDRLQELLNLKTMKSRNLFVLNNNALTLTDCYWIKNKNENTKWSDINFFDNKFSNENAHFFLNTPFRTPGVKVPKIVDPNSSPDGYLPKAWVIDEKSNKRILIKDSSGSDEIIRECIWSDIMGKLNVEHAKYYLYKFNNNTYSASECICNNNQELIHAWDLTYLHNINLTTKVALNRILDTKQKQEKFDKMLILDFILANEDRHWNNFSVLRNPDTMEDFDLAPIYDNGNSLWYHGHIGEDRDLKFSGIKTQYEILRELCPNLDLFNREDLIEACSIILKYNIEHNEEIHNEVIKRIHRIYK